MAAAADMMKMVLLNQIILTNCGLFRSGTVSLKRVRRSGQRVWINVSQNTQELVIRGLKIPERITHGIRLS